MFRVISPRQDSNYWNILKGGIQLKQETGVEFHGAIYIIFPNCHGWEQGSINYNQIHNKKKGRKYRVDSFSILMLFLLLQLLNLYISCLARRTAIFCKTRYPKHLLLKFYLYSNFCKTRYPKHLLLKFYLYSNLTWGHDWARACYVLLDHAKRVV